MNGNKFNSVSEQHESNNATEWDMLSKEVPFNPNANEETGETERKSLIKSVMEKINKSPRAIGTLCFVAGNIVLAAAIGVGVAMNSAPVQANHCYECIEKFDTRTEEGDVWTINLTDESGTVVTINHENLAEQKDELDQKIERIEASVQDGIYEYCAVDENANGDWDSLTKINLETGRRQDVKMTEYVDIYGQRTNMPLTLDPLDNYQVKSTRPVMTEEAKTILNKLPNF